jgi:hypothetical protein
MMFVLVPTAAGPLLTTETSAAAAATAMLQLLVAATDAKSRTLALKGKVPAEVGVPMSSPVAATRFRPGGSDPVIENV